MARLLFYPPPVLPGVSGWTRQRDSRRDRPGRDELGRFGQNVTEKADLPVAPRGFQERLSTAPPDRGRSCHNCCKMRHSLQIATHPPSPSYFFL